MDEIELTIVKRPLELHMTKNDSGQRAVVTARPAINLNISNRVSVRDIVIEGSNELSSENW